MVDIVVSEFMEQAAIVQLSTDFDVLYDPQLVENPARLEQMVAGARALIVRNRTQVCESLLEAAPRLEVVGRLGVGLDNIDLPACQIRGIDVLPAAGANASAVAEYVIAGALMLVRGVYQASDDVASGTWPREQLVGREIAGRNLGLVGFGATAREVARRAVCLDMGVSAYDPHIEPNASIWRTFAVTCGTIDSVLATSDVISLHAPLSSATHHLVGAAEIALMKPGAVLINTARGGLVDENALVDALYSGHLGGAMVDVFEIEPLPDGSVLQGAPHLWLTPHIAGITEESNRRVSEVTASNVIRSLRARRAEGIGG